MTTETIQSADPWRTEQFRLTAFPVSGRPAGLARDWWNTITGTTPGKITEDPRTGVVQLQGTVKGTSLLMVAEDNRLEVRQLFTAPRVALSALPVFSEGLQPFVELAERWLRLETCPQLQRLAFGAVVMKPAHLIEDCRSVLDGYLPSINMQTTELRDFLYQTNRRRSSETISDLEINRLMKWSVQQIQEIVVSTSSRVSVSNLTFASRLEADINSAQEQVGSLRSNRLIPLFKEFVRLADQITTIGDHP